MKKMLLFLVVSLGMTIVASHLHDKAVAADYFLEALEAEARDYYSPAGGENEQDDGVRIDYWNVPEVVLPGQTVHSSLAYTYLSDLGVNSIVYKTVLADWQPTSALVTLENGQLRGPARTVRKNFSFTAPTTPGLYRMRLAMTWAYKGIHSFYGDGPFGDASNPGVGHYAEVWLKVENPPETDYFLEALEAEARDYYSPAGGENEQDDGVRIDYWNVPEVVLPGQTVHSSLAYTYLSDLGVNSIVYKTVLADWQPTSALVTLENGQLRGPARTVRKNFSFTAPTTPGLYRMRLAMTWAYKGIHSFYGDGPFGDAWNPGVGHYAEVWLKVENPPETDYFLEALEAEARDYYSPAGGENEQDDGVRIDYWNVPEVVLPGQTVHSSLAYTYLSDLGVNSIVYKTVLADWQPTSALVTLENSELRGPARTVRKDFSFTAPTTPGLYRMRLAMTWAYKGIHSFYGDGPFGDAWNPGVGHYAEVWLKVVSPTDIKANGSDGPITIDSEENLSVTVALDPQNEAGVCADWWVAVDCYFDGRPHRWYHFNYKLDAWLPGVKVTAQGKLAYLPAYEVLNQNGLHPGTYIFWFVVDTNMNGIVDVNDLYYDKVTVNVQ